MTPAMDMRFTYDAAGNVLGYTEAVSGKTFTYVRNAQGDIVMVLDETGAIAAEYAYDAWGLQKVLTRNMYTNFQPFGYRGYIYDNETGFCFLKTRYYDPQNRRFISPDCLFIAGDNLTGANMYAYCNGNPVMYRDPTGQLPGDFDKLFESAIILAAIGSIIQFLVPNDLLPLATNALKNFFDLWVGEGGYVLGSLTGFRQAITGLYEFIVGLIPPIGTTPRGGVNDYVQHWWGAEIYLSHDICKEIQSIVSFADWQWVTVSALLSGVFSSFTGGAAPVIATLLPIFMGYSAFVKDQMGTWDEGNGVVITANILPLGLSAVPIVGFRFRSQ